MQIKICGIKDELNAFEISALDVDYLGLIFAKSKRAVSLKKAQSISLEICKNGKKIVGVFVDESFDFMLKCVELARLSIIQTHKPLLKSEYLTLKAKNVEIWQVISVENSIDLKNYKNYDLILFDAKGALKGGNGFSFDWNLLKNFKQDFALAGGIGLSNIKDAMKTGAKILDLNSKLEDENGLKDIKKVKQILKELK